MYISRFARSGLFGCGDAACYFVHVVAELERRLSRQGFGPEAINGTHKHGDRGQGRSGTGSGVHTGVGAQRGRTA